MSTLKSKAKVAAGKAAKKFPKRKTSSVQRCSKRKSRPKAVAARSKQKCIPKPGKGWREDVAGPPPPCNVAWNRILTETHRVWKMRGSGEDDFMARNQRITAAYAQLFRGHPSFRFMGAAVFGSKQVGCGLDVAKNYFGRITDKVFKAADEALRVKGIDTVPEIAALTFVLLNKGNIAVFKDIYPLHLFYHRYGRRRLKECSGSPFPRVPRDFRRAFRELDAGCTLRANFRLLRYEQKLVLQREVFNNRTFRAILVGNELISHIPALGKALALVFGLKGLESVLSSSCHKGPSVDYKGIDPAPFEHRWPFAKRVLRMFNELYNRERKELMRDITDLSGGK